MKIDKNSYGTIACAWLVSGVIIYLCMTFIPIRGLAYTISAIFLLYALFVTWFHRVPVRHTPNGEKIVTSGADGKVVIIQKVFEKEYLKKECIQVSVYMNFFNVHANFWPVDGSIDYYKYYPGEHFFASKPKASEENEHSCVGIVTPSGQKVFFKQIAGGFARRIVCYGKSHTEARSGEQCGIIKFGSRIDMFLPLDADIKVQVGDYVRACETVLAELSE